MAACLAAFHLCVCLSKEFPSENLPTLYLPLKEVSLLIHLYPSMFGDCYCNINLHYFNQEKYIKGSHKNVNIILQSAQREGELRQEAKLKFGLNSSLYVLNDPGDDSIMFLICWCRRIQELRIDSLPVVKILQEVRLNGKLFIFSLVSACCSFTKSSFNNCKHKSWSILRMTKIITLHQLANNTTKRIENLQSQDRLQCPGECYQFKKY